MRTNHLIIVLALGFSGNVFAGGIQGVSEGVFKWIGKVPQKTLSLQDKQTLKYDEIIDIVHVENQEKRLLANKL